MTVARDVNHDFDFLFGRWNVMHRRLNRRLAGDTTWREFAGTASCEAVLGGHGNLDQIVMPDDGCCGATLRLWNPATQLWSLYWADSQNGTLCPPVIGRFSQGRGEFHGEDTEAGQAVQVRFIWSHITAHSARWEQAFSVDGEATWETNWTMQFTRVAS